MQRSDTVGKMGHVRPRRVVKKEKVDKVFTEKDILSFKVIKFEEAGISDDTDYIPLYRSGDEATTANVVPQAECSGVDHRNKKKMLPEIDRKGSASRKTLDEVVGMADATELAIDTLNNEITDLRLKIRATATEKGSIEKSLTEARSMMEECQKENKQLQTSSAIQKGRLSLMEKEKKEMEESIKILTGKVEASEKQCLVLQENQSMAISDFQQQMEARVRDMEKVVMSETVVRVESQKQVEKLKEILVESQKALQASRLEFAELEQKLLKLQEENAEERHQREVTVIEAETLKAENSRLSQEVLELQKQLQGGIRGDMVFVGKTDQVAVLEKENLKLRNEMRLLAFKCETAERQGGSVSFLEAEVRRLREELLEKKMEFTNLKRAAGVDTHLAKIAEAEEAEEKALQKVEELESELSKEQMARESLESMLKFTQEEQAMLRAEKQKLMKDLEVAKRTTVEVGLKFKSHQDEAEDNAVRMEHEMNKFKVRALEAEKKLDTLDRQRSEPFDVEKIDQQASPVSGSSTPDQVPVVDHDRTTGDGTPGRKKWTVRNGTTPAKQGWFS